MYSKCVRPGASSIEASSTSGLDPPRFSAPTSAPPPAFCTSISLQKSISHTSVQKIGPDVPELDRFEQAETTHHVRIGFSARFLSPSHRKPRPAKINLMTGMERERYATRWGGVGAGGLGLSSALATHTRPGRTFASAGSPASARLADTGAPTLYSPAESEQTFMALEDSCVVAALKGVSAGFLGGSLLGAVFSNWSDSPLAVHNQRALPALQKTGALMVQHGSTLGAVGLAYAAVECASRSVRGKNDVLNGVLGGVAAGAVLGARSGNLRAGAVGMIVLGAVSAATDASGWKLTGQGVDGKNDGNSPVRKLFPYST